MNDDVDAVDDEEEEDVAAAANEEETVNTSDSDEEINRLNASSSSLAADSCFSPKRHAITDSASNIRRTTANRGFSTESPSNFGIIGGDHS